MTQEEIQEKLKHIYKKQLKWDKAEAKLQAACTHANVIHKYNGNSGNYDPTADSYWIEYACPDCEKKWQVDQ
jgi:hypothetical protein